MNEISKKLDEKILEVEEYLSNLTPGTDSYTAAAESLAKLYKNRIDENKAEQEHQERVESRELEENKTREELTLKHEELKEQKKDRWTKIGLGIAGVVIPTVTYLYMTFKGLEFEQTGSITSPIIRSIFTGFKPKV